MAIDFWKGSEGTAGAPSSGDFLATANWSAGLPTREVDVVFGAGDYDVALADVSVEVGSLNLGAGATLSLTCFAYPPVISIYGDSANFGTIGLFGAGIGLDAGVTLTNLGRITFSNSGGYLGQFVGGIVVNEGVMTQGWAGGYGFVLSELHNDATGVISSALRGVIALAGVTTNDGRIEALTGSTVTTTGFDYVGSVTNLSGSMLTGGTWAAIGADATLQIAGATITTLGAGTVVTLDGAGSNFRLDGGSGNPFYLEQTLNFVDEGATLEVLGGRDWTTTEYLTVRGALHLGGGAFAPGDLRIEESGTLSGFGAVASQAIVDGKLSVAGGETLAFTSFADFNGKITGNGTLALSGGSDTFTTGKVSVKHMLFDGADVQFDKNLTYAGDLTVTAGTIDVKDSTLTLAGKTIFDGTGIDLLGGPGGRLSVTGTAQVEGGETTIAARAIRVDGTLGVDHATLEIAGVITGGGTLSVGRGGVLEVTGSGKVGTGPLVSLDGVDARLVFDNLDSNGVRIAHFDARDRIEFTTLDSDGAKLSWRADADGQGGTLKVTNGAQTATLHLEENYTRKDFAIADDGQGGAVVTIAKTSAFALAGPAAFGDDMVFAAHHAGLFDPHGMLALA